MYGDIAAACYSIPTIVQSFSPLSLSCCRDATVGFCNGDITEKNMNDKYCLPVVKDRQTKADYTMALEVWLQPRVGCSLVHAVVSSCYVESFCRTSGHSFILPLQSVWEAHPQVLQKRDLNTMGIPPAGSNKAPRTKTADNKKHERESATQNRT